MEEERGWGQRAKQERDRHMEGYQRWRVGGLRSRASSTSHHLKKLSVCTALTWQGKWWKQAKDRWHILYGCFPHRAAKLKRQVPPEERALSPPNKLGLGVLCHDCCRVFCVRDEEPWEAFSKRWHFVHGRVSYFSFFFSIFDKHGSDTLFYDHKYRSIPQSRPINHRYWNYIL